MSQWGAQPPVSGQVTFFDPSKFQSAPASQPNQTQVHNDQQGAGHNAWNSWGTWDKGPNPYAVDAPVAGNTEVTKDQTVNNDFHQTLASQHQPQNDQSQQQWYGQNSWNQEQGQNSVPAQNSWDPNVQGQWDPVNQQWVQTQYNYGEYTAYNNYGAGQNGNYTTGGQNGYENTDASAQVMSSANYYGQETPNVQYTTAQNHEYNVLPVVEGANENFVGHQNDLDVSQSTTESGSGGQSLGNVEDGGTMGGFYNNDEYEDEDDDDDESGDSEEDDSEEESESNININSATGLGASHIMENENEQETVSGMSGGHIQSQNVTENVGVTSDVTNQMQELKINDGSSVSQTEGAVQGYNYSGYSNVPTYSNQSQFVPNVQGNFQGTVPFTVESNNVPAPLQPPSQESTVSWPPPEKSGSGEVNEEHSETLNTVTATPTFSDWEMVPPHGAEATHSRNASVDNNVKFFISSANSSARVSPASSSKGADDLPEHGHETAPKTMSAPSVHNDNNTETKIDPPADNYQFSETIKKTNVSKAHGPPPLPPMAGAGNKGGNPFRKTPNPEQASINDASLLSSTQLDVTRPNYENSPVILGKSISPIMANIDNHIKEPEMTDSPDLYKPKTTDSITDTPVTKQTRKHSGNVKQSPIMPRKESPFQPPKQDQRIKPLKALHDIPGIVPQEQKLESDNSKNSVTDRKERTIPEQDSDTGVGRRGERPNERNMETSNDRGYGRKTPDWDSKSDRRTDGRRENDRDRDRGYGRRTPDWDSSDRRNSDRRTPDRETRYRGDRDRGDRDRGYERPSRQRQSAFHHIQTNRGKNNVSPAASLLDIADSAPAMSNILLVPQANSMSSTQLLTSAQNTAVSAPLELKPVASLITSLSEQMKNDDSENDGKGQGQSKNRNNDRDREKDPRDKYRDRDSRDNNEKSRYRDRGDRERDRGDLRGNRSYESLKDRNLKDSRNNSRERLSIYGSRNSLDGDDSRDRGRRGDSRDRSYRDDYYDKYRDRDRPQSRGSMLDTSRRDYRDRDRDRDSYRRDRYDRDRPRSRQGERDRAYSRQGDGERPRSRTDYDKEYRDRDRNRGYDYEDYYRRGGNASQYYDRQYYDYYYGNYSQGGYYDEHGYYHADTSRYQYDHYQRRSRAGTPGSLSDGGQEIASLAEKNKSADKADKRKRFEYPPDLYDYSQHGYDSYYGYEQNGYRWDPDVSAWVETTTEVIPQRQTPEKFVIPHMRACFGPNGQLVKMVPNRPADGQPATVEIHDVQNMLEESEESEYLNEYPGPLVRGDTHKNDVLLFCQGKARQCSESMQMEDRESAELIWRFLELLIKQNGTVVGTDIADLLLQGHEPTTVDYRKTGMKIAPSADNLDVDDAGSETSDTQRLSRGTTPIDRTMINKGRSLEEVTDRFRHLLMFGRKKDALDWAMKNNLWGHALFLASKMDTRAHANVMTRFANVAMRMNDPLQTLYQLMSGRQPAAVTCVTEERWGDWRPHLAMILSNHTPKPELDKKSMTTLGDTLASRGFLHASHFCYLMSRTSFGTFNKKSSKLVLIGSSHGLPLEYFTNNEAIQCTEIYEYALALGHALNILPNFQSYKYLYATRLADYGYAQNALHYCEVIARQINANPAFYPHILVKLVYDLSSQLKFSDPSLEETEDEQDPDWLRGLHTTLVQFEEGAIQPMSGSATPAYFGGRTTASSESGEVGMYMQGLDNGQVVAQESSYGTNVTGMYNVQQSQYQNPGIQEGAVGDMYQNSQGFETTQSGSVYGTESMIPHGADPHQPSVGAGYQYQQGDNSYQYSADGQPSQQQWIDPSMTNQTPGFDSNQLQAQPDLTNQMQTYGQTDHGSASQFQHYEPNQHWSHGQQGQTGFHPDVHLGESQTSGVSSQSNKRSSLASTSSVQSHGDLPDETGDDVVDSGAGAYSNQPSIFDLQPTPGKIIAPKIRPRTISESSAGSGRDRHPSGHGGKSAHGSGGSKDSLGQQKQGKGASGPGFFSKIGGFFTRKNEMKLPDDKEPAIVWDPVKKRWVDKDSDEQEEGPAAPPPKDTDLPGSAPQAAAPISQQAPVGAIAHGGSSGPSDPPPPGGNKFSRRKGIGARSQYVDVMNPKPTTSASVPSNLFHTLPNSHSAPAIFNPMGGSTDTSSAEQAPQVQEAIPEERNNHQGADHSNSTQKQPNNLHLPPLNENLSRNSSASSLSREVQRIMKTTDSAPSGAAAQPPAPGGLPTMFNPATLQTNQGFKQPAPPGPGHRLSNRRVYPK